MCKRRFYFWYTILFALLSGMFLCFFSLNGKSVIWDNDAWSQHYRALVYYGQWQRSIWDTLIREHTLRIPTFSFSIGYGSDILTALQWYVIGDPFALLSVFVPEKYTVYLYTILIFVRLYLAGIVFSLFCFSVKGNSCKQANKEDFDTPAVLAGALVYTFCGYAILGGIPHPYIINPMIFFPLILLGAEKIMEKNRPALFVLAVAIAAISNFYFFYMMVILTILYVICRLAAAYPENGRKRTLVFLGQFAGYGLLGCGMGAIALFPALNSFANSARAQNEPVKRLFYNKFFYEDLPETFLALGSGLPGNSTIMGFGAVALLAVILLFIQKEHKTFKVLFVLLVLMVMFPAAGRLMNGFSYASNRWIWGFCFFVSYITALKWKSLFSMTSKEKRIFILSLMGYFILCLCLKALTEAVLFAMMIAFLMAALFVAGEHVFKGKYIQILLFICIVINAAGNMLYRYSPRQQGFIQEFVSYEDIRDRMDHSEAVAVHAMSGEEQDFFRYTGDYTTANGSLYSGLHNVQYYWSMDNNDISLFRSQMALSDEIGSFGYQTLDVRTILSTLANVKYYVQGGNGPYGYSYLGNIPAYSDISDYYTEYLGGNYEETQWTKEDEELIKGRIKTYPVYENDCFLPFGYTYAKGIAKDRYDSMTPLEKQEAMLQGCVVEREEIRGEEAELTFSGSGVEVEIIPGRGLVLEEGRIRVTSNNASLNLIFEGLGHAETYLYITNLHYNAIPFEEKYSKLQWELLSAYTQKEIIYEEKNKEDEIIIPWIISAYNSQGEGVGKKLSFSTPAHTWHSGREDFMVNLGYDINAKTSVTIQFPTIGEYTFDAIEVLCQPMDHYEKQVQLLAEDVMEDVDFHENEQSFATDKVTGKINLKEPKYLVMTIPYTKGWRAYVNGAEQELLKANTMYTALYLEAGEHEIELKYVTPGLREGMAVSLLSTIILVGLMIGKRR